MHKVVTTQQLRVSDESMVAVNRRSRRWKQAVPVTLPFRVYSEQRRHTVNEKQPSLTNVYSFVGVPVGVVLYDGSETTISLIPTGTREINDVINWGSESVKRQQ